jgi:hypothetical protein
MKPSIRKWDGFYKSVVYAPKELCLTQGDILCALGRRVRLKLAEGTEIDPRCMRMRDAGRKVSNPFNTKGGGESLMTICFLTGLPVTTLPAIYFTEPGVPRLYIKGLWQPHRRAR